MKELILDDGSRLLYQLSVKRVKNMNLRVRPDGSVSVSVSRRISQRQAEDFIRSHIDWIRRAQSRSLKRTPVTLPAGLVSGDLLRWQGKEYAARVETAEMEAVIVQHEIIVVRVKENSPEAAAQAYVKWYRREARILLSEALERVCPRFAAEGVRKPSLTTRLMASRWGSCSSSKGRITINLYLCQLPIELAEFVIGHELCHFLHPNHSAVFYADLERIMPGYHAADRRLKEYSIL